MDGFDVFCFLFLNKQIKGLSILALHAMVYCSVAVIITATTLVFKLLTDEVRRLFLFKL